MLEQFLKMTQIVALPFMEVYMLLMHKDLAFFFFSHLFSENMIWFSFVPMQNATDVMPNMPYLEKIKIKRILFFCTVKIMQM